MCKSEDIPQVPNSSGPTEEKEGAAPTTHATKPSSGENDRPVTKASYISDMLCCGRSGHIASAKELGVWDKSLEDQAGIVSQWLLHFLNPLLSLGSHKVLDAEDIGVPSQNDRAEKAYRVAMEAWEIQSTKAAAVNKKLKEQHEEKLAKCKTDKEREKVKPLKLKDPSIAAALATGYGKCTLLVAILYYVISALLGFVPVLILNNLVSFFESGEPLGPIDSIQHPWCQVIALGLLPFIISLLQTRHLTIMSHAAVFVRTAVSTMLYRKALRVSAAGRAKTSTGQVVNMMSNDTAQLQRFLQFIGYTMVAPIQIILALALIYQQVGNATWVGVGFMVFLMPINTVVFSIVSKQRREVLKYSDLRVKMMNEILSGIRIIKFYAWERPFGKEVGDLRGKELKALTKLAYTSAIGFSLILMAAPLIQPVLVFVTYVAIQDEPLTASTAFTTVALFNMMRFPFAFLPMGLLQYIQSKISLSRLERYLDLPELSEYVEPNPPPSATESEAAYGSITVNGTFSWVDPDAGPVRPIQDEKPKKVRKSKKKGRKSADEISSSMHSINSGGSRSSEATELTSSKGSVITLRDINCHIPSGSLVAVVGTVGSGKSSLLSAILGELEPIHDSKVYLPRPQGRKDGFVSFCSQTPWVVNDTLRGNILFGRHFDSERYEEVIDACALRDDLAVLPAGDMTEIGERGINLSGGQKARVSLARAMYSKETKVVLLDDPLSAVDSHVGEWIFSKAISGSVSSGMTRIIVTHHVHLLSRCDKVFVMDKGTIQHHGSYEELISRGVDFAGAIDVSKIKVSESKVTAAETVKETLPKELVPVKKSEDQSQLQQNGKKLVKDEEREEGSVAGSAYMHYARVGGLLVAFLVLLVQAFGRGAEVMAGFWLAFWAEEASDARDRGGLSASDTHFYVGIYAVFGFIGVCGLTFRSILIAVHRLGASKILHDGLTESILRAPVSFFDVTPTGRVLNRFAADMDKIDLELTQTLSQGISTLFNVLGALAAIIAATRGTFLIPLVPISYCYFLIQKWFRKTSTELQRINSIANSPIFADFSQTLSGTSTIRAYGEETRFFDQCKHSFDTMNASYILIQLVSSWLSLRLDILGGFIGAFIGGLAVATYSIDFIPAGWLGLALSYSIEVTNFLKHGVKMIATLEAQMNSVERVLFYTNQVEPEAPETVPEMDPAPDTWPTSGNIEFRDASLRYRDGPLVLKNISLQVKGSEKIGVCGRTGSGKSSLMISLFRITELEDDGGAILIDDVNVRQIGTSTLRLNLSIIPQDPIIFSNTVRYNLDPFRTCSSDELWEVLRKVQMDTVIRELPNGLEEQVSEGGENFSQGQRQLLCIARALLRKPKILVMDEATASIDNATDAHIQTMIRENFKDATVLTIAHRLNTIMDSDRVLVLDNGNIAEFDSPENLLKKEDGLFKAMIEKSKAASAVTLVED